MQTIQDTLLFWQAIHGIPNLTQDGLLDELLIDSQFNIDVWYQACKDYTFPTQFIPVSTKKAVFMNYVDYQLSQKEAAAIQLYYEQNTMKQSKLKPVNYKLLSILDHRIEECGKEMGAKSGFFVRLSSRSPKDSGFGNHRMREIITKELDAGNVRALIDPIEKQNAEWKAFFAAQINSLCIATGREAIELLIDSERVYIDIKRAFELYNLSGDWNVYIAVRKWIPHSIQGEFRGFVWKKKLTAINMVYFPDVVSQKEQYLKMINDFYDKIVDFIPYQDFIIDFSVELHGSI